MARNTNVLYDVTWWDKPSPKEVHFYRDRSHTGRMCEWADGRYYKNVTKSSITRMREQFNKHRIQVVVGNATIQYIYIKPAQERGQL